MIKNEQERQRIGMRIAEIRRQHGLTQRGLAALCGLADSHIARIEKGRYSVGFDTLQAIASAMGGEVEIVLREEAKQEAPNPSRKEGSKTHTN